MGLNSESLKVVLKAQLMEPQKVNLMDIEKGHNLVSM